MMAENLFQKIIDKQIPAQIVYEDADCLAFRDINPQAPTHVLVIPRRCVPTLDDLTDADTAMMGRLMVTAANVAKQLGLGDGYRVVFNCKEQAGQTVPHIHAHVLGGRDFGWPPG